MINKQAIRPIGVIRNKAGKLVFMQIGSNGCLNYHDPISASTLAKRIGISKKTYLKNLKGLEKHGLIIKY